ncbi:PH domain-containing protein [Virgibacillus sp. FSP13]
MYFPSKKDTWLALIIWGVTILMGWQMITYKSVVIYIIGLLTIALLLWLWFGTGYKIEEGLIKIKSGPFRSKVKIEEIKRLNATKTPLAGPALSIDRIEILHRKYDVAIVSPKNAADFIRILLNENKYIQVDNNLSNDKKN